jgi:fructokinase
MSPEDPAGRACPVVFGEVLFDRFPDGSEVLGGAPFNVAWHLQAFGQRPLFVSRVGEDALGRRIGEYMRQWGMDTTGLQLDAEHPTGTVEVRIVDGEPSYDIVDDRAYDHIDAEALPSLPGAGLLYHGTLALRGTASRSAFEQVRLASGLPVFLDINLRAPWWQPDAARALLENARWVKLNEHELELFDVRGDDLAQRAESLQKDCGLELLVVTRGSRGALARTADGRLHEVAPRLDAEVVDTVGAGDAFASVLILGLLNDWPLPKLLARAQDFAAGLVGVRGATVADPAFYARYRRDWGLA